MGRCLATVRRCCQYLTPDVMKIEYGAVSASAPLRSQSALCAGSGSTSAPQVDSLLTTHLLFPKIHQTSRLKMAGRGTVKPSGNFNASADAEVLHKAMKGLGTDEDAILQLLTARSNTQRQEIKNTYKTLFGKDLIDDLKGELGGKFESLIVGLMTHLLLMMSHPSAMPSRVLELTRKKEYDDNLEEDICGDTSGHFKRLLVILLQGNRQTGIQEGNIEADAQALFKAGEQKYGTDEQSFVTILGNRSAEHLRKVFDAYMKMSGFEMEESIQRETSGNLRALLLAVVKCARSVPGAGTDDDTLIRVMVTRSEVDMLDIRKEFRRMFACSLHSMVKGDTGGDYRKALLLLCGGDDA
ncbi:hypothetical protein WMY93_005527 [Mugilogobius chulae]|uniref:Annexin n=1 Tax=Mugilogobius chulae TaxID=88201 RepID=A0AAW0PR14_9GOBI